MKTIIKLFLGSFLAFSVACTSNKTDQSTLKIVMPSAERMRAQGASPQIMHVVINISGPGIQQPIVYNWDAKDSGGSATPPSTFNFTVPMGQSRLIQALLVTSSSSGTASSSSKLADFYYGDVSQSLSNANESAVISVSNIANAVSVSDGRIAGRYLTGADSGPSKQLQVQYVPAGKPGLIIQQSPMVNGWFSSFGLDQIGLRYVLDDGFILFDNATLSSFVPGNPSNSPSVMAIQFPDHYRQQYNCNSSGPCTPSWQFESGSKAIVGFFGPGAKSASSVCYAFQPDSTLTNVSSSATGSVSMPVIINPSAATAATAVGIYGGVASSDSRCLAAAGGATVSAINPAFGTNFLSVVLGQLNGSGSDSVTGIYAPFSISASSSCTSNSTSNTNSCWYNYLQSGPSSSANSMQMVANLLPSTSALFDGVKIYVRPDPDGTNNEFHDSLPCSKIASGEMGFSYLKDGSIANGQMSISLTQADFNLNATGQSQNDFAVCLSSGGQVRDIGFYMASRNFNFGMNSGGGTGGSGGSSGPSVYAEIHIEPPTGYSQPVPYANYLPGLTTLLANQCYPFNISIFSNTTTGPVDFIPTENYIFNLNHLGSSASDDGIYTDPACTAKVTSGSITVASGSTNLDANRYFYYKSSTAGVNTASLLTVTSSSTSPIYVDPMNSFQVHSAKLSVYSPGESGLAIGSGSSTPVCTGIRVYVVDATTNATLPGFFPPASQATLTVTDSYGATLHINPSCSDTGLTSKTWVNNSGSSPILDYAQFYVTPGTNTNGVLSLVASTVASFFPDGVAANSISQSITYYGGSPGSITYDKPILANPSGYLWDCIPVDVLLLSAGGNVALPATNAMYLTFSGNGSFRVYSDEQCNGLLPSGAQVPINFGDPKSRVYTKVFSNANTPSLIANVAGVSNQAYSTLQLGAVQTQASNYLKIDLGGSQTLTSASSPVALTLDYPTSSSFGIYCESMGTPTNDSTCGGRYNATTKVLTLSYADVCTSNLFVKFMVMSTSGSQNYQLNTQQVYTCN